MKALLYDVVVRVGIIAPGSCSGAPQSATESTTNYEITDIISTGNWSLHEQNMLQRDLAC